MNFFKKYKNRIILVISALVILAASFVFDGSRHGVSDKNDGLNNAPVPQISEKLPQPAEIPKSDMREHDSNANDISSSEKQTTAIEKSDVGTDESDSIAPVPENNQTQGSESGSESIDAAISETDKGTTVTESDAAEKTCTVSISCAAIFDNMDMLDQDKADFVPKDGIVLKETKVKLENSDSVFDVLARVTRDNSIHMEFTDTPVYKTKYVEGIANIYELDCGSLSGWQYSVNGVFPNVGCSAYYPKSGDVIEWKYTCDLGRDIGNAYTAEGGNG